MFSLSIFVFLSTIQFLQLQAIFTCEFDYGEKCLEGLPTAPYLLFNESSADPPRQPLSDVTATQTSNDQGDCSFPSPLGSFQTYFCHKFDENLPATCSKLNDTGLKINCSEGEYGYHMFEQNDFGSYSYMLDLQPGLADGEHCVKFYYHFSDGRSSANIEVIMEEPVVGLNQTIARTSTFEENRWNSIQSSFHITYANPTFYFQFNLFNSSSPDDSFFISIDQIQIIDIPCAPPPTTTTTTPETTTSTTPPTTTSTTTPTMTTATSTTTLTTTTITTTTTTTTITTSTTTSTRTTTTTTTATTTTTPTRSSSTTSSSSTSTSSSSSSSSPSSSSSTSETNPPAPTTTTPSEGTSVGRSFSLIVLVLAMTVLKN